MKSYKSRQQHLVDKHKFPTKFEFFKKAKPSKHQRQKNQWKKQHGCWREEKKESNMDVDEKTSKNPNHEHHQPKRDGHKVLQEPRETGMEVEEVDELASAVSKLSTSDDSVPSSISFGHRHARGFTFLPRSVRQDAKRVSRPDAKR